MSGLLYRIGAAAATRPRWVIASWLIGLLLAAGLAAVAGAAPHDDYHVSGTASQRGSDLLRAEFPALSGADARVVVHDRAGHALDTGILDRVAQRLLAIPSVGTVSPPRMSADRDTAMFSVSYTEPVTELGGTRATNALVRAAAPASETGLQVALGGQVPETITAVGGVSELLGIGAALVILLVSFGSVAAAGVPLVVAFIGLGIGSALISLIAATTDVSTLAPTLGTMVGLGIGIDYALLLVTRHVEGLRAGLCVRDAAAKATATAGTSVIFAGTTVLLSLMGLRLAGLAAYASTGFTTAAIVITVVLAAVTLVPALCGLAGHRLLGRRAGRPVRITAGEPAVRTPMTARWARRVGNRPLPWALGALALLFTLAAPMLGMRTWPQDAGSQPTSTTQRQAYDLIAHEYGAGANGPLLLAADLTRISRTDLGSLTARVTHEPGVAGVSPPVVSPSGRAAVVVVTPTTGPSDRASTELTRRLRADVLPPSVQITGVTALFSDISDLLAARLWWIVAFVVAVSLLLLVVVFRSVVVPVKAAVMNLLSITAAYGVVTAVFQWGWGARVLGLPHDVPVSSWLPILMFTVLFGLSMDYEVFLLSRVREEWLSTGDPLGSVVRGLSSTGRVITSAALIMIAVFAGFALDPDVTVKMMGVGMAVAILVDATVVRMVLVPATMTLLGRANWWLPGWLDRLLPHIEVPGDVHGEVHGETPLDDVPRDNALHGDMHDSGAPHSGAPRVGARRKAASRDDTASTARPIAPPVRAAAAIGVDAETDVTRS